MADYNDRRDDRPPRRDYDSRDNGGSRDYRGGGGGFSRGGYDDRSRGGYDDRGYGGGDRMAALGANLKEVDWKGVKKVEGEWNYYQGNPVQRSQEEISAFLKESQITIIGDRVPAPILSFDELTAPEGVMKAFDQAGFKKPTPIQSMAWPILLSGRDLVGIAKTGSGKTLGFIAPAIMHIAAQPPLKLGDGPIALVLAPTRELAVQIEEETNKVTKRLASIRTLCVYGGTSKYPQVRALKAGVHILVATPGRLLDMLEARATNLLRITYLVLDEADRMLDMGFEPQIRKVLSQIRPDRQTMMFSATWPQEIRAIAQSFQRDFVRIHIGSMDLTANTDVTQHFYVVKEFEKMPKLIELFRGFAPQRVLVFVKTKKTCDQLHRELLRMGVNATAIHGDKEQYERDRTLAKFKRDTTGCLVATDVACRGLDIKELDVVINYDFPLNIEDYVHRIGMYPQQQPTSPSPFSPLPTLLTLLLCSQLKSSFPFHPHQQPLLRIRACGLSTSVSSV